MVTLLGQQLLDEKKEDISENPIRRNVVVVVVFSFLHYERALFSPNKDPDEMFIFIDSGTDGVDMRRCDISTHSNSVSILQHVYYS